MSNPIKGQFEDNLQDLRHLVDALPVCISYVDNEYRYQFINQVYINWFGISKAEVIGKHMAEVIGEAAFEHVKFHVEQALSGQSIAYETTVPYLHGGARDIAAQILPVFSSDGTVKGCYAMIVDISQRKRDQQQLHINEERWQLALEASGDGVWDW
ncbi:PAS domain-containing protein [Undibacterium sp. TJN19]|uniref:PAS domain-containing protein n=1 Tax=Undibacterium sp. TJN19 TaxID=3413055 RepID=UPI003BEFC638